MNHLNLMLQTIELASNAKGKTSPNPMVGCIIVKNEKIVTGYHHHAGSDHAEIDALKKADSLAAGSTMYVNLEPCSHHGLTPPCVESIIAAKIKKIYIAMKDPNPLVNGRSIKQLQQAGIKVNLGLCATEAEELNKIFIHFIKNKRPYVIAKWAMSLDGKIASHNNCSKWITGQESREHCHELRRNCDAILIGSNTALIDNPYLTARNKPITKQPIKIILDSSGSLPLNLNIFTDKYAANTILVTCKPYSPERMRNLDRLGVEIMVVKSDSQGKVSVPSLLDELGKRKICSLLVEGGAQIHTSFFNDNLVNEALIYIAPKIIGGIDAISPILGQGKSFIPMKSEFTFQKLEQLGDDILLTINFNNRGIK